jgi:hypothetical protein
MATHFCLRKGTTKMSLETGIILSIVLVCSFGMGMTAFIIWLASKEDADALGQTDRH